MRILFLLFLTAAVCSTASGQTATPARQWTDQDRKARINLNYHLGSVVVPDGYKGAITANWIDAWGGYLSSADGTFKIYWSAGMIQTPFGEFEKRFVWKKLDEKGDGSVSIGEATVEKRRLVMAKAGVFPTVFGAEVKSDTEMDVFLGVVRSYVRERCNVCRTLPMERSKGQE